jgi:hypothetical protein
MRSLEVFAGSRIYLFLIIRASERTQKPRLTQYSDRVA